MSIKDNTVLPIVIYDDILSKVYNFYKDKDINNTGIAYGVYVFLYKTARIQNNIRVYASDNFIREGVGIGRDRLKQVKKDLKEMGLIETIRPRDKNGHFTKEFYTEVKFIWKSETTDKLFYQESTKQTRYKIARELLLLNFDEYNEIEADYYEFEISINGRDETIETESFYFENGILKCIASFNGDNQIEYTVPSEQAGDIIIELANNYKFSFNAIDKVLQMST